MYYENRNNIHMQIMVFSVPAVGGEAASGELNKFLRSKKVLQVDQEMIQVGGTAYWSYSVRYVEDYSPSTQGKPKIDYMEVLSPEVFEKFKALRKVRTEVAKKHKVAPYLIFLDKELAEMAAMPEITEKSLLTTKGIGSSRVEKWGRYFFTQGTQDEASESPL
jgi:superfamily II DNA helicase RecQ